MRRQIWARFITALAALALLGGLFAGLVRQDAAAFQSATPTVGDGSDLTGPAVASPVASPAASPVAGASPTAAVETANQIFDSGPWRVTVVLAEQGASFSDLGLTAFPDKSWLVVVVDAANWSAKTAALDPRGFQAVAAGSTKPITIAPSTTKRVAKQLGMEPLNPNGVLNIDSNLSDRLVLVFQVDATGLNYSLTLTGTSIPLAASFAQAGSIAALPGPAPLPALQSQTFSAAVSGSSVKLKSGTVTLAGVDAPTGNDCYSAEAAARITRVVKGKKIATEPAGDGAVYLWVTNSDGSQTLLNASLIAGGYAAAASGLTGPYASWFAAAEVSAQAAGGGLWAACTNQHGQARTAKAETTAITANSDGKDRSYVAWTAYPPKIVTTPDGGAWVFYSAQPTSGTDSKSERLFASHFDPATGKWSDGTPMPGGQYQMGVSAVVDSAGLVHIVYSDQANATTPTVLMYSHEDGNGGWTKPVPVAADPNAGYQLYPSLAIDKNDVLHVAWQDQRVFSVEARAAEASNADILVSDLKPGSTAWTKPFLVNTHFYDAASLLPHLVVDGDRLVLVWSVYAQSLGLSTAARIDWSTRPIDQTLEWTIGQPLVAGRGDAFGGRLVDLAADPTGGVVMVFARQATTDTFLFLRRLKPGATDWSGDILITFGTRGNWPNVTVAANGDVYVSYEATISGAVKVTAVAVPYRSVVPGPETVLTSKEANSQGRPGISTDLTSKPWVVYIAVSKDGKTNKVEVLRNGNVPAVAPAAT